MDTTEFDIDFLSQKLAENPQSPLFARLADLYLQKGQPENAVALCEEGVKLYPSYVAGQVVLGKCYLALQEFTKAHDTFLRALSLSPTNKVAHKLFIEVPEKKDEPLRATESDYFTEKTAVEPVPDALAPVVSDEAPAETSGAAQFEIDDNEMSFAQTAESVRAETPLEQPDSVVDDFTQSLRTQNLEAPTIDTSSFAANDLAPQEIPYMQATIPSDEFSQESDFPTVETYIAEQSASLHSTMTLDEYLANTNEAPAPESAPNEYPAHIENVSEQDIAPAQETNLDELAEKLQNAERIVPRETTEEQASPTYNEPISDEPDIVTPTLAEIYASQGEYNAAIQAYEILMLSHPDDQERFQKRIDELQAKLLEKDG